MKRILIVFFLFNFFSFTVFSQKSLSEYAYVLVPQQFEFQRGVDQFQINTLTRHLFREAGFNSIYDVELKGLPRCDGLYADLISDSNFINTVITVVLKDCNNNIVFLSEPGTSKEKDIREGYHQAIRRAFFSIENLAVKQGDLVAFRESVEKRDAAISMPVTIEAKPKPELQVISENKIAYLHNNSVFYLEPTENGYILYKKQGDKMIKEGDMSQTSRAGMYLFHKNGNSMLASFDDQNSLIIDNTDENGQRIQDTYTVIKE